MPTIEFSSVARNAMNLTFINMGYNTSAGGIAGSSFLQIDYLSSSLRIMKGTPPTSWSELTSASASRSTDILINYSNASAILGLTSYSSSQSFCNISTPYTAATQSGTASWFWFLSHTGDTIRQQLIGTSITTVGGGGDLVISSTNIVSGYSYRVINLYIDFPGTYTY